MITFIRVDARPRCIRDGETLYSTRRAFYEDLDCDFGSCVGTCRILGAAHSLVILGVNRLAEKRAHN